MGREDGLEFSGKFAGGIRNDIARKLPWYVSDWKDGFTGGLKVFTAALYMFFGCLAPGIAFGAYFDQHSGGQTGVVEYLITQAVSGIIFAIISGQPLIMLRPTGPITVFISTLYNIATNMDLPFLPVMSWCGIGVGSYMIIIALTDTCALIVHCSRFTQDLFGCFVSVIFISLGIGNVIEKFGVEKEQLYSPTYQLILTVGTLYIALVLAGFNKQRFFNAKIRDTIADFAVPLAVTLGAVAGNLINSNNVAKLEPLPVPSKFGPTMEGRDWIVNIFPDGKAGGCIILGLIAGIPLVMLFFVDQNVTTLLTQHKDNKLKKGGAFHYNFFILGVFNIVFPLFGCPFVTGSLPHSPQFTRALTTVKMTRDEGGNDKREVVGVCENRVSPLLVNVLILICLPIINELSKVPTAVICDGLFLVMGITGLPGNHLFERLKLVFTEEALYPPMDYTKEEVPRSRMHLFTLFQFLFVCTLYVVARSPIATAFPVFLICSMIFKKSVHKITGGFITREMVQILDYDRPEPAGDAAPAEKLAADTPDTKAPSAEPDATPATQVLNVTEI